MSTDVDTSKSSESIRLLPSEVVDQIAAGEVVERPAHLVKELVENSIDAGATSIEVEYDQGGRRVRVTDDGHGISADDLPLALARHATSKITVANDLWSLGTFGFRGEALASIAAVSRLTLQSRLNSRTEERPESHLSGVKASIASKVTAEFGKLSPTAAASGGNPGTTILIEELFSNLPARLKFLKSEAAEAAQIKGVLRALALANESVEFRVRTKGKIESVWPRAGSFLERAGQVLDAEKLFENEYEFNGYKAHVVFASPHEVTGNARGISIFVQKRWVQDRGLQHAVIEAFRGLLMHGEYPIACVRLEAPPEEVDVNIHPTKSQVKFRDSQSAFRAVNRCVREALERAPWLEQGAAVETRSKDVSRASMSGGDGESPKRLSVADLTRPYSGDESAAQDPAATNETGSHSMGVTAAVERFSETLASAPVYSTGRFAAPEFDSIQFKKKVDHAPAAVTSGAPVQADPRIGVGPWSRLQVIGQADLTYIVAQDALKLVLVDQHAAHERVAYERLMRAWADGEVDVQTLLLPLTLELEAGGPEALLGVSDELSKIGVQIDQMGPQTIAIRARPALISDSAIVKALEKLSNEMLDKGGSFALERKISDLCATMACHSVVRAGQALSHEQMRQLLSQMDEFPLSSFCPHGRPVSVDYPFSKLERDFGRIV